MNGVTLVGPPGSTLALGPTTLDAPAWVQAIGSILAIVLAIWIMKEQRRQQLNDEVVRDAAFAEYIERFLDEVGNTFRSIDDTIDAVGSKDGIAAASASALQLYKRHVIDCLKKLADMDLTSWPDIEFANAFNDTYLDMNAQFNTLEATAAELMQADVREKQQRIERAARARAEAATSFARWQAEEEEALGDVDDDEVVVRNPGESWGAAANRHREVSDEEHDERIAWNKHAAEMERYEAEDAERWVQLEWEQEKEILQERLIKPLHGISDKWSSKNTPLCKLIEAYKSGIPDKNMNYTRRAEDRKYRPIWKIL